MSRPRKSSADAAEAALPLHEAVRRQLADRILRGRLPQGTTLPGEAYLAQEYGVGIGTIRRALSALVAEGLLTRRRKTGTVVTGRAPHHRLGMIYQYFRLHRGGTTVVESERTILAAARRACATAEAETLLLQPGSEVVEVHRLRSVGGAPVMHERIVLPANLAPDFPLGAQTPDRVYVYLLEHDGIRIAAQREHLRAELATDEDRKILRLASPAAVLSIEATAFDRAGTPIIRLTQRASTVEYLYVNELQQ